MIRNILIRRIQLAPIVFALGLVSGAAHAALQGRDLNGSTASFEAWYDTDRDITWLADANYAQTSGYDADGAMNWTDANTWAASLSFTDTVNNRTYDNWRLPTVNPVNGSSFNYNVSYNGSTDVGYSPQGTAFAGSTGSEMAHLFYNTLDNSYAPQAGWGLTNTGPFTNLQAYHYWSATEYAPDTDLAWNFSFFTGYQNGNTKYHGFYALAVSPGDVGAVAAVPEADTWAMLLAGLGLVGWMTVRRRPG